MYKIAICNDMIGDLHKKLIDKNLFNVFALSSFNICDNKLYNNVDCIWTSSDRNPIIPSFGFLRYGKNIDTIILSKFNIPQPETFYLYSAKSPTCWLPIISKFEDNQEFIFKPLLGARGLGQILLNKKEFENIVSLYEDGKLDSLFKKTEICVEDSREKVKNTEDIIDNYKIKNENNNKAMFSKTEYRLGGCKDDYSLSLQHLGTFDNHILQKKVDIEEEYRVLLFYKQEPIIIKRSRDKHWQANSCITGEGTQIDYIFFIQNKKANELLLKCERLLNYVDTPTLSFDFYKDTEGNFGVFEFSVEYGIVHVPKYELYEKYNRALLCKVEDTIDNFNKNLKTFIEDKK